MPELLEIFLWCFIMGLGFGLGTLLVLLAERHFRKDNPNDRR